MESEHCMENTVPFPEVREIDLKELLTAELDSIVREPDLRPTLRRGVAVRVMKAKEQPMSDK